MTDNLHEFNDIKDFAARCGVGFRFDAAIFACLDGNKKPLAQRVAPEPAVDLELEDPETVASWCSLLEKQQRDIPSDKLTNVAPA